jgi:hypothetical protein
MLAIHRVHEVDQHIRFHESLLPDDDRRQQLAERRPNMVLHRQRGGF